MVCIHYCYLYFYLVMCSLTSLCQVLEISTQFVGTCFIKTLTSINKIFFSFSFVLKINSPPDQVKKNTQLFPCRFWEVYALNTDGLIRGIIYGTFLYHRSDFFNGQWYIFGKIPLISNVLFKFYHKHVFVCEVVLRF